MKCSRNMTLTSDGNIGFARGTSIVGTMKASWFFRPGERSPTSAAMRSPTLMEIFFFKGRDKSDGLKGMKVRIADIQEFRRRESLPISIFQLEAPCGYYPRRFRK